MNQGREKSADKTIFKSVLTAFILFAASFLPFSVSLKFPLLEGWDDHIYVTNNSDFLEFSTKNIIYWFKTPCEGCYLPLTMISYMLDYHIGKLNALPYRIQNILWHFLSVSAFYLIMRKLRINKTLSLLCAVFFAVHPQRVESVVWVSERKDVICAAFYLWSLFFFIKSELVSDKKYHLAVSFILAIFAFLSKPMAVSLPFVMLAVSFYIRNAISSKIFLKLLPFFFLTAIFIPVAVLSQDIPAAHLSLSRRALVALMNIPWYVFKTFLPMNLSPIYPRIIPTPERILGTLIFYSALFALIFYYLKNGILGIMLLRFSFLFAFIVSLMPVSGIVPLGAIDYADRYSYIPLLFLLIFIAFHIEHLFENINYAKKIICALCVYIFLLSGITFFYTFSWSSYRAVLETAAAHKPPAYIALGALADLEFFAGNKDRIPEIANIVRNRERGWESENGVERIIFKVEILEMHYYYQRGQIEKAASLAEKFLTKPLEKLIPDKSERAEFINFLQNIINSVGIK